MAKESAKSYVRLSSQISQEASDKLTEVTEMLGITKTKAIEQAINDLFFKAVKQQNK